MSKRAAEKASVRQSPLVLDFEDKKQVLLRPENKDAFVMFSDEVLAACVRAHRETVAKAASEEERKERQEKLKRVLGEFRDFSKAHADIIRSCYVTVRDTSMAVYFVLRRDDYDAAFDD